MPTNAATLLLGDTLAEMGKLPSKGRIEQNCGHCGVVFAVDASRLKHGRGKHCSPACQYAAIKARPRPLVKLTCIGCGTDFTRKPSQTKRKGGGKYCTRECRDKHWVGDKNPNWQNGDRVYKRGPRWHSIRRRIVARDEVCQCCGAEGQLHVHHVIPFRVFDDIDLANHEDNLVALCPPCHRRADARHKWAVLSDGAGAIQMNAGGVAWQMAREKGLV